MINGNYKVTFSYRKSHYCLASISRLNSSHEMVLGKNWIFFFFNSYRGYRECIATNSRLIASRESFWASVALFVTVSLLPNLRKMHVFSFYVANVTSFEKLLISLTLPLSNLSQPKTIFHSNPINSKLVFYNFNFKLCFLKHISSCLS